MKRTHKIALAVATVAVLGVGASAYVKHTAPVTPAPAPSVPLPTDPIAETIPTPLPGGQKAGVEDIYPNSAVTPGATNPDITQANIGQTICNPNWSTASIRPPVSYTTPLKIKQLANGYAINGDTNTADYEEDHLISLELGGSPTSPQNLWPEPYTVADAPDGGAKSKDTVENYLHKQVCSGNISLADAQQEIATDWYAVLKLTVTAGKFGSITTDDNDPDDN